MYKPKQKIILQFTFPSPMLFSQVKTPNYRLILKTFSFLRCLLDSGTHNKCFLGTKLSINQYEVCSVFYLISRETFSVRSKTDLCFFILTWNACITNMQKSEMEKLYWSNPVPRLVQSGVFKGREKWVQMATKDTCIRNECQLPAPGISWSRTWQHQDEYTVP